MVELWSSFDEISRTEFAIMGTELFQVLGSYLDYCCCLWESKAIGCNQGGIQRAWNGFGLMAYLYPTVWGFSQSISDAFGSWILSLDCCGSLWDSKRLDSNQGGIQRHNSVSEFIKWRLLNSLMRWWSHCSQLLDLILIMVHCCDVPIIELQSRWDPKSRECMSLPLGFHETLSSFAAIPCECWKSPLDWQRRKVRIVDFSKPTSRRLISEAIRCTFANIQATRSM